MKKMKNKYKTEEEILREKLAHLSGGNSIGNCHKEIIEAMKEYASQFTSNQGEQTQDIKQGLSTFEEITLDAFCSTMKNQIEHLQEGKEMLTSSKKALESIELFNKAFKIKPLPSPQAGYSELEMRKIFTEGMKYEKLYRKGDDNYQYFDVDNCLNRLNDNKGSKEAEGCGKEVKPTKEYDKKFTEGEMKEAIRLALVGINNKPLNESGEILRSEILQSLKAKRSGE